MSPGCLAHPAAHHIWLACLSQPNGETSMSTLQLADVGRQLLTALEAAEGRQRNRTLDVLGLTMKRVLLARAVQDDLVCAMTLEVLAVWRLTEASRSSRHWLIQGARSDDVP
jgi:hypothetical protein